jgi:hypothetical protein
MWNKTDDGCCKKESSSKERKTVARKEKNRMKVRMTAVMAL